MTKALALAVLVAAVPALAQSPSLPEPFAESEPAPSVVPAPALAQSPSLLDPGEEDSRAPRVAIELAAGILGAALPDILWLPFFAFGSSLWPVMLVVAALAEPLSICTAIWLAHGKVSGRGSWFVGLIGSAAGVVLGAAFFGVTWFALSGGQKPGYAAIAGGAGAAIAIAATAFALEISHDRNSAPQVSLGGAPIPGGAAGFVTVRF